MATHAPTATIDQLIISSPYDEPSEHWKYDRETRRFTREAGRRPAGYVRASDASKSFDDPGEFVELPLVNKIRPRVDAWRSNDYPGASGITRRLLKHWQDTEQRDGKRFFFCQLEAMETLMWLAEAPESERVGIKVPGDGGEFTRLCSKMATGSGKTILMSMLIAWQVLNKVRMQRIVFETASEVYDQMAPKWKGSREYLLAQLVRLVEHYIDSGRVIVDPPLFNEDDKRRRIVITLNMTKVVQHLWEAIRFENALTLEPVFDTERPIRATGDMLPWYSGKACEHTKRSHINMCVYDSRWEANESLELDRNPNVRAWVKNDHIGFEITYSFKGIIHKFRPDYLVRLTNGKTLVLEVKGQDDQQQQTKREFLAEWVRAVNGHCGFGTWTADVSRHPKDVLEILERHNKKL